ncbi:MAG TPA: spermidine synthase, partial [Syntrophomonadaceae bacterium]|nr:spermidine synthase [Syntrophomonadaceae bacterium]
DSTEPVGPAVELFGSQFYQDAHAALNDDGMLVVQSESPFINQSIIQKVNRGIKKVFPLVKLYLANVPTYPTGLWSFTVGSKSYDPEKPVFLSEDEHKYYNSAVHQAAFQLPQFVKNIIAQEE